MKRIIFFLAISFSLLACDKDDEGPAPVIVTNSIAEDLKQIIQDENVERVRPCTIGSFCSGAATSMDYSFPGDNFIRIDNEFFNLQNLMSAETTLAGPSNNQRIVLILWFPS